MSGLMLIITIGVAGFATGVLARQFHWNARIQSVVASLTGATLWFAWAYTSKIVFEKEPFAGLSPMLDPGWIVLVQNLAVCAPLGRSPVVAELSARVVQSQASRSSS